MPLSKTENPASERTPLAIARGYAPLARANASPETGWRRHTLAAGVPLNSEPLGVSIMAMSERVVALLERVKSTSDFGYVVFDSIDATNALGDNALHCVCVWGDLEATKLLVESGINLNQQGEFGFTPLRIAVDFGHLAIAEYLKANGADPSAIDAPERFDRERNDLHMQRLDEELEALEKRLQEECP